MAQHATFRLTERTFFETDPAEIDLARAGRDDVLPSREAVQDRGHASGA
jgi:hypothetical protein